jgi:hypothetical protein
MRGGERASDPTSVIDGLAPRERHAAHVIAANDLAAIP